MLYAVQPQNLRIALLIGISLTVQRSRIVTAGLGITHTAADSTNIKKLKQIQKQTVKKRDLQNKEYSETYNKSKLTKFFSLEDKNIDKVNKLLKEELKLRYKHIWIDSLPWPISVLVEAITMYAILYYVLNIDSGISLGTVYIFLYYIRQCFSPLKELFNQIEEIQTSQVSLERINTILSIQETA